MRSAWRIVWASRSRDAFTGEGSWLLGGRWNSPGRRVIYLSEHESLAALELLVHSMPLRLSERYLSFRIEWIETSTEYIPPNKLPRGWNAEVPIEATQLIGDRWVAERRSLALAVPSVLSTTELNFLINPGHPDFKKIKIGAPVEFRFDPRLAGR